MDKKIAVDFFYISNYGQASALKVACISKVPGAQIA